MKRLILDKSFALNSTEEKQLLKDVAEIKATEKIEMILVFMGIFAGVFASITAVTIGLSF